MKRITATVALGTLLVGLIGMIAPTAWACSCAQLALEDYVDEYAIVFAGREVGREAVPGDVEQVAVTFAVESVFRGEVTETFTVYTGDSGAMCGVGSLTRSGVVGVLAWTGSGEPTIGLCGSIVAPDALAALLGPPTAPTPLTSPPPPVPTEDPGNGSWPIFISAAGAVVAVAGLVAVTRRRPQWVDGYRSGRKLHRQ